MKNLHTNCHLQVISKTWTNIQEESMGYFEAKVDQLPSSGNGKFRSHECPDPTMQKTYNRLTNRGAYDKAKN